VTPPARRRLAGALLAFGRAAMELCAAGAAAIDEGAGEGAPRPAPPPPLAPAPRQRRRRSVVPPPPTEPVSDTDVALARRMLRR
jgi:hypothetical protein